MDFRFEIAIFNSCRGAVPWAVPWTDSVYKFLSIRNQIFGQDFNLEGALSKNIFPKNHEISDENS